MNQLYTYCTLGTFPALPRSKCHDWLAVSLRGGEGSLGLWADRSGTKGIWGAFTTLYRRPCGPAVRGMFALPAAGGVSLHRKDHHDTGIQKALISWIATVPVLLLICRLSLRPFRCALGRLQFWHCW